MWREGIPNVTSMWWPLSCVIWPGHVYCLCTSYKHCMTIRQIFQGSALTHYHHVVAKICVIPLQSKASLSIGRMPVSQIDHTPIAPSSSSATPRWGVAPHCLPPNLGRIDAIHCPRTCHLPCCPWQVVTEPAIEKILGKILVKRLPSNLESRFIDIGKKLFRFSSAGS